jgi:hypothetical protein
MSHVGRANLLFSIDPPMLGPAPWQSSGMSHSPRANLLF